ncbi:MAG: ferritin [Chloroflexi bacterium]|nr:ferritin [Chloroflexota bacterium]
MDSQGAGSDLLSLLNQALARELQVCIQYMIQHAIGAAREPAPSGKTPEGKRSSFVGSHSMYWLPGITLKKIAIAEMRHAESIAERIVHLGGEPTTEASDIVLGQAVREMLELDREEERSAIVLYQRIIAAAQAQHDEETVRLFQGILSQEEKHHQAFSGLIGQG